MIFILKMAKQGFASGVTDTTDWFRTLSKISPAFQLKELRNSLKPNLCEFFVFSLWHCECLFLFAETASDSKANKVGKNLMKQTVKHTALDARSYFYQNEDVKESRKSQ